MLVECGSMGQFALQVSAKDMSDHTLKLTVIDGGRTKKRGEIGHVTFPLKDLEIGDGTEQQLFKLDLEKVFIATRRSNRRIKFNDVCRRLKR